MFRTGIEILVEDRRELLAGRRVGMAVHAASLTADGQWSAARLRRDPDIDLALLLGPEHGVFGEAGAGESVPTRTHPAWGIPIHSLYGAQRRPTAEMLDAVDTLVIDFQDLGVRCYTYVSTLFHLLDAAADQGKAVIVTDRPVPLPDVFDGPMLDTAFRSFVAQVPVPLVYGMTQGETALYLDDLFDWDLDLHVVSMCNYKSNPYRQPGWPPWVPPSPGIRSWESAWCYPATVFTEAIPVLDCGRGGPLPFQVLGAPWLRGQEVAASLTGVALPGVQIHPHDFFSPAGHDAAKIVEGIRLTVTDPASFRPVTTGLTILETLQTLYGPETLWGHPDTRPAFFDQLCGTDTVRRGLQAGIPVQELEARWQADRRTFLERRAACLLYP